MPRRREGGTHTAAGAYLLKRAWRFRKPVALAEEIWTALASPTRSARVQVLGNNVVGFRSTTRSTRTVGSHATASKYQIPLHSRRTIYAFEQGDRTAQGQLGLHGWHSEHACRYETQQHEGAWTCGPQQIEINFYTTTACQARCGISAPVWKAGCDGHRHPKLDVLCYNAQPDFFIEPAPDGRV